MDSLIGQIDVSSLSLEEHIRASIDEILYLELVRTKWNPRGVCHGDFL